MKKIFGFCILAILLSSCPQKINEPELPEVPEAPITFTVKYEANLPGAFGSVDDQQHMSGFAIALRNADYKKLMYDFTGWYTEPGIDGSGAGDVFDAGKDAIVPNPDKLDVVTLYAGWKNRGGYNRAELQEIPIDPNTTEEQIIKFVDPNWKDQEGPTLEVIAKDLQDVQAPITLDLSGVAVEDLHELFTNLDRVAFGDKNARYDAEGNVVIPGASAKPINIERVVIPTTLENFSSNLFANCMAVKEFVVPEENEWFFTNNSTNGGKGEAGAGHILYQKMQDKSSPNPEKLIAVAVATSFTGALKLDANTVVIGHQAAYGCQGIESVNWTDLEKLEKIGMYSFMKCKNLKSVTVPKNVTRIEGYAFTGCYNIETLDFESNSKLYYIGSRAFQTETKGKVQNDEGENMDTTLSGLSGKTINLPASLTKLGGQVFGNMYNKMTINFSNEGSGTWYYFVTSEKSYRESGFDSYGWGDTSADKEGGVIDKLIAGKEYIDSDENSQVFKATKVGSGSVMSTTPNGKTGYNVKPELEIWTKPEGEIEYRYEKKECSIGGYVECYWFRK